MGAAHFSPGMLLSFFGVLGAVFGSFGNVLIYRLPEQQSIGGRSHCPQCGKLLHVLELIPILSFVALRGRCSGCHKPIALQYPLVEFVSALLFLFALWHVQYAILPGLLLALILWLLFLIAVIDARTSLIPDALSVPIIGLALLFQWLSTHTIDVSGLFIGGGFFAVQWLISRGRWVGSGDILLGAGIGLLLANWRPALALLFFAYVIGAAVATFLLTTRRKTLQQALPFGPFLVIGAYLALIAGEHVYGLLSF